MRIEGNSSTSYSGTGNTVSNDPVAEQYRKQIQEVKKQLQELSADKSISAEEKSEQQKELSKKLNDLNTQLRQHELDRQQEQRKKAAQKQETKENVPGTAKNSEKGNKGSILDSNTIQAMAAAETSQAMSVVKEGVRMDLSHEALSLNNAVKEQELKEGGVSPLRAGLNELYGDIGKVAGEAIGSLKEAQDIMEEAMQTEKDKEQRTEADNGDDSSEDNIPDEKEKESL